MLKIPLGIAGTLLLCFIGSAQSFEPRECDEAVSCKLCADISANRTGDISVNRTGCVWCNAVPLLGDVGMSVLVKTSPPQQAGECKNYTTAANDLCQPQFDAWNRIISRDAEACNTSLTALDLASDDPAKPTIAENDYMSPDKVLSRPCSGFQFLQKSGDASRLKDASFPNTSEYAGFCKRPDSEQGETGDFDSCSTLDGTEKECLVKSKFFQYQYASQRYFEDYVDARLFQTPALVGYERRNVQAVAGAAVTKAGVSMTKAGVSMTETIASLKSKVQPQMYTELLNNFCESDPQCSASSSAVFTCPPDETMQVEESSDKSEASMLETYQVVDPSIVVECTGTPKKCAATLAASGEETLVLKNDTNKAFGEETLVLKNLFGGVDSARIINADPHLEYTKFRQTHYGGTGAYRFNISTGKSNSMITLSLAFRMEHLNPFPRRELAQFHDDFIALFKREVDNAESSSSSSSKDDTKGTQTCVQPEPSSLADGIINPVQPKPIPTSWISELVANGKSLGAGTAGNRLSTEFDSLKVTCFSKKQGGSPFSSESKDSCSTNIRQGLSSFVFKPGYNTYARLALSETLFNKTLRSLQSLENNTLGHVLVSYVNATSISCTKFPHISGCTNTSTDTDGEEFEVKYNTTENHFEEMYSDFKACLDWFAEFGPRESRTTAGAKDRTTDYTDWWKSLEYCTQSAVKIKLMLTQNPDAKNGNKGGCPSNTAFDGCSPQNPGTAFGPVDYKECRSSKTCAKAAGAKCRKNEAQFCSDQKQSEFLEAAGSTDAAVGGKRDLFVTFVLTEEALHILKPAGEILDAWVEISDAAGDTFAIVLLIIVSIFGGGVVIFMMTASSEDTAYVINNHARFFSTNDIEAAANKIDFSTSKPGKAFDFLYVAAAEEELQDEHEKFSDRTLSGKTNVSGQIVFHANDIKQENPLLSVAYFPRLSSLRGSATDVLGREVVLSDPALEADNEDIFIDFHSMGVPQVRLYNQVLTVVWDEPKPRAPFSCCPTKGPFKMTKLDTRRNGKVVIEREAAGEGKETFSFVNPPLLDFNEDAKQRSFVPLFNVKVGDREEPTFEGKFHATQMPYVTAVGSKSFQMPYKVRLFASILDKVDLVKRGEDEGLLSKGKATSLYPFCCIRSLDIKQAVAQKKLYQSGGSGVRDIAALAKSAPSRIIKLCKEFEGPEMCVDKTGCCKRESWAGVCCKQLPASVTLANLRKGPQPDQTISAEELRDHTRTDQGMCTRCNDDCTLTRASLCFQCCQVTLTSVIGGWLSIYIKTVFSILVIAKSFSLVAQFNIPILPVPHFDLVLDNLIPTFKLPVIHIFLPSFQFFDFSGFFKWLYFGSGGENCSGAGHIVETGSLVIALLLVYMFFTANLFCYVGLKLKGFAAFDEESWQGKIQESYISWESISNFSLRGLLLVLQTFVLQCSTVTVSLIALVFDTDRPVPTTCSYYDAVSAKLGPPLLLLVALYIWCVTILEAGPPSGAQETEHITFKRESILYQKRLGGQAIEKVCGVKEASIQKILCCGFLDRVLYTLYSRIFYALRTFFRAIPLSFGVWFQSTEDTFNVTGKAMLFDENEEDDDNAHETVASIVGSSSGLFWMALPGCGALAKLSEAANEASPADFASEMEFSTRPLGTRFTAWFNNILLMLNITIVCLIPKEKAVQSLLFGTMSLNYIITTFVSCRQALEKLVMLHLVYQVSGDTYNEGKGVQLTQHLKTQGKWMYPTQKALITTSGRKLIVHGPKTVKGYFDESDRFVEYFPDSGSSKSNTARFHLDLQFPLIVSDDNSAQQGLGKRSSLLGNFAQKLEETALKLQETEGDVGVTQIARGSWLSAGLPPPGAYFVDNIDHNGTVSIVDDKGKQFSFINPLQDPFDPKLNSFGRLSLQIPVQLFFGLANEPFLKAFKKESTVATPQPPQPPQPPQYNASASQMFEKERLPETEAPEAPADDADDEASRNADDSDDATKADSGKDVVTTTKDAKTESQTAYWGADSAYWDGDTQKEVPHGLRYYRVERGEDTDVPTLYFYQSESQVKAHSLFLKGSLTKLDDDDNKKIQELEDTFTTRPLQIVSTYLLPRSSKLFPGEIQDVIDVPKDAKKEFDVRLFGQTWTIRRPDAHLEEGKRSSKVVVHFKVFPRSCWDIFSEYKDDKLKEFQDAKLVLAKLAFRVENLPNGDVCLKHSLLIPPLRVESLKNVTTNTSADRMKAIRNLAANRSVLTDYSWQVEVPILTQEEVNLEVRVEMLQGQFKIRHQGQLLPIQWVGEVKPAAGNHTIQSVNDSAVCLSNGSSFVNTIPVELMLELQYSLEDDIIMKELNTAREMAKTQPAHELIAAAWESMQVSGISSLTQRHAAEGDSSSITENCLSTASITSRILSKFEYHVKVFTLCRKWNIDCGPFDFEASDLDSLLRHVNDVQDIRVAVAHAAEEGHYGMLQLLLTNRATQGLALFEPCQAENNESVILRAGQNKEGAIEYRIEYRGWLNTVRWLVVPERSSQHSQRLRIVSVEPHIGGRCCLEDGSAFCNLSILNDTIPDASRLPLMLATQNGHFRLVRRLVQANADTHSTDLHGQSPLMVACAKNDFKCANALMEANDVSPADLKGIEQLLMNDVEDDDSSRVFSVGDEVTIHAVAAFKHDSVGLVLCRVSESEIQWQTCSTPARSEVKWIGDPPPVDESKELTIKRVSKVKTIERVLLEGGYAFENPAIEFRVVHVGADNTESHPVQWWNEKGACPTIYDAQHVWRVGIAVNTKLASALGTEDSTQNEIISLEIIRSIEQTKKDRVDAELNTGERRSTTREEKRLRSTMTPGPASVIHDFNGTLDSQVSVSKGDTVDVIQLIDGLDWLQVSTSLNEIGLVPASYVDVKYTQHLDGIDEEEIHLSSESDDDIEEKRFRATTIGRSLQCRNPKTIERTLTKVLEVCLTRIRSDDERMFVSSSAGVERGQLFGKQHVGKCIKVVSHAGKMKVAKSDMNGNSEGLFEVKWLSAACAATTSVRIEAVHLDANEHQGTVVLEGGCCFLNSLSPSWKQQVMCLSNAVLEVKDVGGSITVCWKDSRGHHQVFVNWLSLPPEPTCPSENIRSTMRSTFRSGSGTTNNSQFSWRFAGNNGDAIELVDSMQDEGTGIMFTNPHPIHAGLLALMHKLNVNPFVTARGDSFVCRRASPRWMASTPAGPWLLPDNPGTAQFASTEMTTTPNEAPSITVEHHVLDLRQGRMWATPQAKPAFTQENVGSLVKVTFADGNNNAVIVCDAPFKYHNVVWTVDPSPSGQLVTIESIEPVIGGLCKLSNGHHFENPLDECNAFTSWQHSIWSWACYVCIGLSCLLPVGFMFDPNEDDNVGPIIAAVVFLCLGTGVYCVKVRPLDQRVQDVVTGHAELLRSCWSMSTPFHAGAVPFELEVLRNHLLDAQRRNNLTAQTRDVDAFGHMKGPLALALSFLAMLACIIAMVSASNEEKYTRKELAGESGFVTALALMLALGAALFCAYCTGVRSSLCSCFSGIAMRRAGVAFFLLVSFAVAVAVFVVVDDANVLFTFSISSVLALYAVVVALFRYNVEFTKQHELSDTDKNALGQWKLTDQDERTLRENAFLFFRYGLQQEQDAVAAEQEEIEALSADKDEESNAANDSIDENCCACARKKRCNDRMVARNMPWKCFWFMFTIGLPGVVAAIVCLGFWQRTNRDPCTQDYLHNKCQDATNDDVVELMKRCDCAQPKHHPEQNGVCNQKDSPDDSSSNISPSKDSTDDSSSNSGPSKDSTDDSSSNSGSTCNSGTTDWESGNEEQGRKNLGMLLPSVLPAFVVTVLIFAALLMTGREAKLTSQEKQADDDCWKCCRTRRCKNRLTCKSSVWKLMAFSGMALVLIPFIVTASASQSRLQYLAAQRSEAQSEAQRSGYPSAVAFGILSGIVALAFLVSYTVGANSLLCASDPEEGRRRKKLAEEKAKLGDTAADVEQRMSSFRRAARYAYFVVAALFTLFLVFTFGNSTEYRDPPYTEKALGGFPPWVCLVIGIGFLCLGSLANRQVRTLDLERAELCGSASAKEAAEKRDALEDEKMKLKAEEEEDEKLRLQKEDEDAKLQLQKEGEQHEDCQEEEDVGASSLEAGAGSENGLGGSKLLSGYSEFIASRRRGEHPYFNHRHEGNKTLSVADNLEGFVDGETYIAIEWTTNSSAIAPGDQELVTVEGWPGGRCTLANGSTFLNPGFNPWEEQLRLRHRWKLLALGYLIMIIAGVAGFGVAGLGWLALAALAFLYWVELQYQFYWRQELEDETLLFPEESVPIWQLNKTILTESGCHDLEPSGIAFKDAWTDNYYDNYFKPSFNYWPATIALFFFCWMFASLLVISYDILASVGLVLGFFGFFFTLLFFCSFRQRYFHLDHMGGWVKIEDSHRMVMEREFEHRVSKRIRIAALRDALRDAARAEESGNAGAFQIASAACALQVEEIRSEEIEPEAAGSIIDTVTGMGKAAAVGALALGGAAMAAMGLASSAQTETNDDTEDMPEAPSTSESVGSAAASAAGAAKTGVFSAMASARKWAASAQTETNDDIADMPEAPSTSESVGSAAAQTETNDDTEGMPEAPSTSESVGSAAASVGATVTSAVGVAATGVFAAMAGVSEMAAASTGALQQSEAADDGDESDGEGAEDDVETSAATAFSTKGMFGAMSAVGKFAAAKGKAGRSSLFQKQPAADPELDDMPQAPPPTD